MYCPVCLNDTLKIASSGVVKFSFNGKSKSTSQFYYNMAQDRDKELLEKIDEVVKDYFVYYSGFQNKETIKKVEATSIDFVCSNKCVLNVNHRVDVIGLLFSKEEIRSALTKMGQKYGVDVQLEK